MGLPLYPTLLIHKSWRQHRMMLRPSRYESFLIMLPFKVTSNLPSRLSIKRTRQSKTMCGMRRKVNQFQVKYFPFISTGTYFHFYSILYDEVEESCLPRKNVFPSVFARLCGSSFMIRSPMIESRVGAWKSFIHRPRALRYIFTNGFLIGTE